MERQYQQNLMQYANSLSAVSQIAVSVFRFAGRGFLQGADCDFCLSCESKNTDFCNHVLAHSYGCYEAERWNGQYIYYCPMSLVFVASVVYDAGRSAYALVAGPLVMGELEEVLLDNDGRMQDEISGLPVRKPAAVNAYTDIQRAVAAHLSQGLSELERRAGADQANLLNTLYDLSAQNSENHRLEVSLELEKRLQRMILHGEKQQARELINQFLGTIYFYSGADLSHIKQQVKDLLVLFSRASIEGGADAEQIFGHYPGYISDIENCRSLEEISAMLITVFNRFVGYVFDFEQFKHADILHKVTAYVRRNYTKKITLQDAADHVALSRSYLSSIFREELGKNFTDFVNEHRLEKSKELLDMPDIPLAEIALLIGYNDQSYYTKVFTKMTGMSPKKYREQRKTQAGRI
ncbi:helix-turn-helix domain-containing protein [Synergistaceae bacterium OttesenSCG-928-D05]|nr:helix-turn-helix domain-containing protein [Synergistaceae bacterium OttesenSCG-928-D05]